MLKLARSLLVPFALLSTPAFAGHEVAAVPAVEGQRSPTLDMKVIRYQGSVNGGMTVEVTNRGAKTQTFTAQGLYFVPDSNPNQAPQRLGAVGPMNVEREGGKTEHTTALVLKPGEHAVVHLDVYCIDSGRAAPSSETPYHISAKRMPKPLANQLETSTKQAADANGGYAAPAAKSAVQSQVWQTRNKDRVKLEGDGAQESGTPRSHGNRINERAPEPQAPRSIDR